MPKNIKARIYDLIKDMRILLFMPGVFTREFSINININMKVSYYNVSKSRYIYTRI